MFTQNSCYDRDWLEKNWRNEDELKKYLGKKLPNNLSTEVNFGCVPTEKLVLEINPENTILGIKVYSGLSWSPKTGYSQPAVDLHVLDDLEFAAL